MTPAIVDTEVGVAIETLYGETYHTTIDRECTVLDLLRRMDPDQLKGVGFLYCDACLERMSDLLAMLNKCPEHVKAVLEDHTRIRPDAAILSQLPSGACGGNEVRMMIYCDMIVSGLRSWTKGLVRKKEEPRNPSGGAASVDRAPAVRSPPVPASSSTASGAVAPSRPPQCGTTFEMKVWKAFGATIREFFSNRFRVDVKKDGTVVRIEIGGFPAYGHSSESVVIRLPHGRISSSGGISIPYAIGPGNIWLDLGNGEAFPHPHVFESHNPCTDNKSFNKVGGLFEYLVSTLAWTNITPTSRDKGKFANSSCAVELRDSSDLWGIVDRQRRRVSKAAGFDVMARDPLRFFTDRFPVNLEEAGA